MSIAAQKFLIFIYTNSVLLKYMKELTLYDAFKLIQTSGYEFSFEEFKLTWQIINNDIASPI